LRIVKENKPRTNILSLSASSPPVTNSAATEITRLNLQAYQRLQLSLLLGLRRQLLIATCDNVQLRDRLAEGLHKDVEMPRARSPLVSLELNLENPAFLAQIGQWLKQHPEVQTAKIPPTFQILGIEGLTRQPAAVQRRFLRHLQAISRYLPQLNVNLLLWLSRPWFQNVKQSVPEFWRWRTGVFEFSGDVTVPPSVRSALDILKQSIQVPGQLELGERFSLRQGTAIAAGEFPLIRVPTSVPRPPQQEEGSATVRSGALVEVERPEKRVEEEGPTTLVLRSLAEIEQLEQQQSLPGETIAAAYLELGDRYRDRIAQGSATPDALSTAIQAYERGLQWSEDDLPAASNILNDLGNFYWMRSRHWQELQPALADLEQAIQYYQEAAVKLGGAETSPQQYATIQNNLGAAYSDLARYGDSAQNLQRSIQAYEEALHYRSTRVDPLKYGSTQNNLGTAYWHLAQQQEPATNLHAAIAAYKEALAQYHPETASMQWAMIQNNLGTAYWNLAQHEQPEIWLQKAIDCYNESLRYRTSENVPAACAATQNNLGTAYWHFSFSDGLTPEQQQGYLQQAIAAYSVAIAIAEELSLQNPPVFVNFDLVATHNNLGAVRLQLATNEAFSLPLAAVESHLEAALKSHLKAASIATLHTESYETTFNAIVRTVRVFYQTGGSAAQNRALAMLPAQLLPSLLPRL
jgi:tetratricopeptide (TPR) repeat protein